MATGTSSACNWLEIETPPGQQPIVTIEMHTCCMPVRIVRSGYPSIEGSTILDKRRFVSDHLDHLRTRLMHEPRGGSAMYGVIPVAPDNPEADMAVLFMHNEGYSTMCGHAVISLGRYALDYGIVPCVAPETRVNIQCPCGLVSVFVQYSDGMSGAARFESVPAFLFAQDLQVELPVYGTIRYDVAFGGAFYAFATAKQFGLDLQSSPFESLRSAGTCCSEAVRKQIVLEHPESPDLAFLYGTILIDDRDTSKEAESDSFCVFADSQVDRSPCGSGVTARMAIQFYKHKMELGQLRTFSGPSGGRFSARALREDGQRGLVVEVSGHGFYSGVCRFSHEPGDPLCSGLLIK